MPKKPLEKLPEAELDVMLALWTHTQPVRTARLLEDLADKAWSLSTLKVLLGRLADKSFVEVTREGRFTLYRARVREEDYRRMETNGLLRRYYKNSVAGMVAAPCRPPCAACQLRGAGAGQARAVVHPAPHGRRPASGAPRRPGRKRRRTAGGGLRAR